MFFNINILKLGYFDGWNPEIFYVRFHQPGFNFGIKRDPGRIIQDELLDLSIQGQAFLYILSAASFMGGSGLGACSPNSSSGFS